MWTAMDTESSAGARMERFDCFFDPCLLDNIRRSPIGVSRKENAAGCIREELAKIVISAELLRDTLVSLDLAECSTKSATRMRRRAIPSHRQLRPGHGRHGLAPRHRSTCNYSGDPVVGFFSSERVDGYRASSTCTRGGSRQTRMYRS